MPAAGRPRSTDTFQDGEALLELIAVGIACGILLALGCGVAGFVLALQLRGRLARVEGRLKQAPREVVAGEPSARPSVLPGSPGPGLSAGASAEAVPVPTPEGPPSARAAPTPETPGNLPLPAPRRRPPPPPAASRAQVARPSLEGLERLVGTKLLGKLGAVLVLVGVAFLLKLLYDHGWIGPAGRVGIGLGAGLVILAFGELRARRFHEHLAQAVSSIGIGTLFLTTFLSYKLYDFGTQTSTFLLLAWLAAFTVALSVLRGSRGLALLGLLCAHAVPGLLASGQDRGEELFAYLGLLSLGGIVLRWCKPWWEVTPVGFVLCAAYFGAWHGQYFTEDRISLSCVASAGILALFSLAAVAQGLRRRSPAHLADTLVIVVAHCFGILGCWTALIGPTGHVERLWAFGFLLAGLALFDLGLVWALRWRRVFLEPMASTLLILAAACVAVIIPAILRSEGAVIGWALLGALLADVGSRSRRPACAAAGVLCVLLAIGAGLLAGVRHTGLYSPILNGVFLAWASVGVAALFSGWRITCAWRGGLVARPRRGFSLPAGACVQVFGLAILYLALDQEVRCFESPASDPRKLEELKACGIMILAALFPCLWLWRARGKPGPWLLSGGFHAVLALPYLGALASLHLQPATPVLNPSFAAALLLPAALFCDTWKLARERQRSRVFLELLAHLLSTIALGVEIDQSLALTGWEPAGAGWVRSSLHSVGWALNAIAVFWLGLEWKRPLWRWYALGLLLLTLGKVFLVDLAEVRQVWRVISFLVLGVVLLACSYLYVRHDRRESGRSDAPDLPVEPPS